MTCQYGHAFAPFSSSRDLFCTSCGTVSIHAANRVSAMGKSTALPANAGLMPPLTSNDPHRDEALEIMHAAKTTPHDLDFEQRLGELFSRHTLPEDVANDLFNDALQFGPTLDLEAFEREAIAPIADTWARRPQVDLADDLDEAFNTSE